MKLNIIFLSCHNMPIPLSKVATLDLKFPGLKMLSKEHSHTHTHTFGLGINQILLVEIIPENPTGTKKQSNQAIINKLIV